MGPLTMDANICVFIYIDTRQMQSINGASLRVLDTSIERIPLKTFYLLNHEVIVKGS